MNPLDFTRTSTSNLIETIHEVAVSRKPIATGNLLIHGDNLVALKQLITVHGL